MKKFLIATTAFALSACLSAHAEGNFNCFKSSKLDGQYMAVPDFPGFTNKIQAPVANTTYTQAIPQVTTSSGNSQTLIVCPGTMTTPFEACVSSPTGNRCGVSAPTGNVTDGGAYVPMLSCTKLSPISGTYPDAIRVSSPVTGTIALSYYRDCNQ